MITPVRLLQCPHLFFSFFFFLLSKHSHPLPRRKMVPLCTRQLFPPPLLHLTLRWISGAEVAREPKVAALLAKLSRAHSGVSHSCSCANISLPHSCARHEAFKIVESQGRYGPVLSSQLPRPPAIPKLPIIGNF